MARQPRTFYYDCPHCGLHQNVHCQRCRKVFLFDPTKKPDERMVARKIKFAESMWTMLEARAKVTPGIQGNAHELLRIMAATCLNIPPGMLMSS